MTSKNIKHANTMKKYGTFQEFPYFHWTLINHQLNHHIFAAHLKILPSITAERINWTHSLIVKKSQIKENAPSVKTNRCHRRSINLGKWFCTINWDKLVKVWMKEIGKKRQFISSWILKCSTIVWLRAHFDMDKKSKRAKKRRFERIKLTHKNCYVKRKFSNGVCVNVQCSDTLTS